MTSLKRNLRSTLLSGLMVAAIGGAAIAEPVKIGVFGPMTGDAAAMGQSLRESVDLAVKEKNAAGGLLGEKIEIVYADDSGKPEEAVNVAKRLISRDEVLLTLGSISSPASLAASQVSRQGEVPQIVIAGTAQKITTLGNKWVFRSPVPDTKLVSDLVDFIHEKFPNYKKFAFLYVNDDFGRGGFEAFKKAGQKHGFEIVAEERYTRGDIDFTSQLGRIKSAGADAMIEWSRYTEGALVAKQFAQIGMTIPRFASDGVATPKFVELGGDAVNGVYFTTHFSLATAADIPAAQTFIEKYKAAYGRNPDSYAAEAYDAITLAILGVEKAGKADREAVRAALAASSFESVRGPFKFDEKGDPLLTTHVVKLDGGKETNARAMAVQN
ncbi:ABC transporter substrate-binding protein [Terrihabitans rhizophilus]|uniref:ABC transporter substrate-binding protein n=1 Tax=Terrihabitans rhizophilus TaxID=3092662 RepID=A0ABU4RPP8_9HYPH|nr:ABC transporter substrate-binding protein [Terrihabitans sp. PJ23]MDX6806813.1 ABC transporter substrate-binding protein [Terrihabitans sp. PJ23]